MGNEAYIMEARAKHLRMSRISEEEMQEVMKQDRLDREQTSKDADNLISELEAHGVTRDKVERMEGMGDLVHKALNKLGITEERFKAVLGLQECGCKARRKFLNKLIPFSKKGDEK